MIGLGTWKLASSDVEPSLRFAIEEAGYRHVDCASIYKNEKEVGHALKKIFDFGKNRREEIFVTSKLWNNMHAAEDVEEACRQTLSDLKLDYLDLYLVHWGVATPKESGDEPLDQNAVLAMAPVSVRETWEAMEALLTKGLVKAIGVSNFTAPMLIDLLTYAKVAPAMNQIELHPYNAQQKLVDFCHYKNIAVTGYSPLGRPGAVLPRPGIKPELLPSLIDDPELIRIARSRGKLPTQVLLRWAIQRNTVAIPKSMKPENIKSNIDIFNFALSDQEMKTLNALDRRLRFVQAVKWWKIPYFD